MQDSLLQMAAQKEQLSLYTFQLEGNKPFFLKANEEIDDLVVYDLDFLLKNAGEYKVSFEPREIKSIYRPEKILSYQRYDQDSIKSNTIYFTIISP